MDTKQKLPCLKGPVTFSKAHHFGALPPLVNSGVSNILHQWTFQQVEFKNWHHIIQTYHPKPQALK